MNNELKIPVRLFSLIVKDERTGMMEQDTIVLTKEQLHACQVVGQSATDLIFRIYNRQGYKVLSISTPANKEIRVDLYGFKGKIIAEGEALFDPAAEEGDTLD